MNKKRGITLIALIVTIIVLLILVAATLTVTLGPNGVIKKSREAKLDNRYGHVMDEVKIRESALELAFENNKEGESNRDFIIRLEDKGLKTLEDFYDEGTKLLKLGRIDKNGGNDNENFKYIINIMDGSIEGREIWQLIQTLPTVKEYPERANMTLKIRTTTANETVTIPISYGEGLTIDWDDNGQQTTVTTDNPNHEYQTAGDYTLKISGKATSGLSLFGGDFNYTNPNIIGIQYWGENDFRNIKSFGKNLQGQIPIPTRNSFEKIKSFSYLFYECINLTGNIPSNLFINCSEITGFTAVFNKCTNLTGSIPANLFINCPNVTSFDSIFYECNNLTGNISKDLFKNCSKVITFQRTFYKCSNLEGNIPEDLFLNCPNVINFHGVFSNCNNLTGSIPENLFINCSKVTNFGSTFYCCNGLTGNISENLFLNCLEVTSFSHTFFNCTGLTGEAPDLWNTHINVTNSEGCFRYCTGLSNYDVIPSTWK